MRSAVSVAMPQMWALRRGPASQRRAGAYLRRVVIGTFACTRGRGMNSMFGKLALGAATEAITTASAVFARRDRALNRAVAIVRDLTRRPRPSADSLRLVHDLAAIGRTPLQVSGGAAIPQELGAALVSID